MTFSFLFVLNSILFGIGLAMDAFSVSLANGLHEPEIPVSRSLAIMYQDAVIHTLIRSGILMLVMAAGGALCLAKCRERKTA